MRDKWIEQTEETLAKLKKLEPRDRMDIAAAITDLMGAIVVSITGWNMWLVNLNAVRRFDEQELRGYFDEMRNMATSFLELDLKVTGKLDKQEQEKKKGELPEIGVV